MTKIIPTDKARQGHWGRHVLIILIVGLILALVAWAVAEFYGEAIDRPGGTASASLEFVSASPEHEAVLLAGTRTFSAFL
jgi:hypothetical protein